MSDRELLEMAAKAAGYELYASPVARQQENQADASQADQKDAARYRWLCANNFDREGTTIRCWLHTWEPHSQTGEPTEWKQRLHGGTRMDEIIDAAMAQSACRRKSGRCSGTCSQISGLRIWASTVAPMT